RTLLGVPMLKEDELIGAIVLYRQEVRPFTEKHIALVENFAGQAIIAIENTRLLNELRQRTDDLSESLQQQTATSEILDVISNSPTDSQPAFEAIVRSGLKLFPDAAIMIALPDGDLVRSAAVADADPAGAEALRARTPLPLSQEFITSAAILDRREVDLPDVREAPAELAVGARNFLASGYRAITVIPMMRGESAIGALDLMRRQPGPLSAKQRELLRIFARQAVIAIENTRLFNELRQRTTDLTESLEQQTATSEVLRVISSSAGALEPVFQAILENGTRICAAKFGTLWLAEEDGLRAVAVHNPPPGFADIRRGTLMRPNPKTAVGRVLITKQVAQVVDLAADAAYLERDPARVAIVEVAGARTLVAVPMLKDDVLMGAISIYRQEVQAVTDKRIRLVQNFAAQAVIAIENTRLLSELRESLQQQTATAEVLQVINSSAGSLTPVFEAMLDRAMHLCEAAFGGIWTLEGDRYTAVALQGVPERYAEFLGKTSLVPGPGTAPYRLMHGEAFVHNLDLAAEEPYQRGDPQRRALVDLGGARTALQAALRKDDALLGIITIYRQEVRPYSDKQIELLQNFAAQAVVAMENARLFNELRQ